MPSAFCFPVCRWAFRSFPLLLFLFLAVRDGRDQLCGHVGFRVGRGRARRCGRLIRRVSFQASREFSKLTHDLSIVSLLTFILLVLDAEQVADRALDMSGDLSGCVGNRILAFTFR